MKLDFVRQLPILGAAALFGSVVCCSQDAMAAGDVAAGGKLALYCAYCHGADGNSTYTGTPRLAGQNADSIVAKLKLYKANQKIYHPMMGFLVGGLNDQDIHHLAAFYASQPVNQSSQPYAGPPALK